MNITDKAYSDQGYFCKMEKNQNVIMVTFPTAGSAIRQPIESFFNWLNEKTSIQRATKVRSTSGLLIHMMGKIAIAFISLIFKY